MNLIVNCSSAGPKNTTKAEIDREKIKAAS